MADSALSKLALPAKIGIGVGMGALLAFAYFVVFYGDVASKIEAATSSEERLKVELQQWNKSKSDYNKDLAELTDREQRQTELNKILPATTEYPAFLSSVQSVANTTGVVLNAWTPEDEVKKEFYARIPMKLELQGRYHQIARFFYGVGQLDRIINMENIALTQPQAKGDEVTVSVKVLATAFRALSGEPDAKADKRGNALGGKP
ncbi:MAG: type 4a pilus biogenesis protein PilO [Polyangiaceae bacterium]|nr:type 4a pilus biogenesis protein PilO [Polyangiaceae bacterium]